MEQERLAKLEEDRLEQERVDKLEEDRLEQERVSAVAVQEAVEVEPAVAEARASLVPAAESDSVTRASRRRAQHDDQHGPPGNAIAKPRREAGCGSISRRAKAMRQTLGKIAAPLRPGNTQSLASGNDVDVNVDTNVDTNVDVNVDTNVDVNVDTNVQFAAVAANVTVGPVSQTNNFFCCLGGCPWAPKAPPANDTAADSVDTAAAAIDAAGTEVDDRLALSSAPSSTYPNPNPKP